MLIPAELQTFLKKKFLSDSKNWLEQYAPLESDQKIYKHGLELEGFLMNQQGEVIPNSAPKIIESMAGQGIQEESGSFQIEYISSAVEARDENYAEILSDIFLKRKSIRECCQSFHDTHFVTRAMPFYLPEYPEEHDIFFNQTSEDYSTERTYFNKISNPDFYRIEKAGDGYACHFSDRCFSLAFISGVHNNYTFHRLQDAINFFNALIYITPFVCGLTANGNFLNGLLKKEDYRLHFGLLGEELLNLDPVIDRGLPQYLSSWDEYFLRQIHKDFIDPFKSDNPPFLDMFNAFREQSWSFVQLKILDGMPGVEYRPVSSQINSEMSVAVHLLVTWLADFVVCNNFGNDQNWHRSGRDLHQALEKGAGAQISFMNDKKAILDHLEDVQPLLRKHCHGYGLCLPETFDAVMNIIRLGVDFHRTAIPHHENYMNISVEDKTLVNLKW